ncbi:putative protein N(5)-glutamine methyltransferase [Actinomadura fibrosa]|uniref:peptide chain release factor N(5)-glutamine methyltransferase n=1 Tax=Actinomadura fibrosa TaxID=111802 RepID=A0ABW2XWC2_9ACTN|nr:putative protein N(5)-glutamine methyltransferase [Actinomadura fibrosa]
MSFEFDSVVSRLRAAGCVFAEDEARLIISTAGTADELAAMVDRRVSGLPLEHVLGWAEFCGIRLAVEPGVFVPRRRTEFLVRQAVAGAPEGAVVLDLCCGSGALGVAVAASVAEVELHASDVESAAVRCARRNVGAAGRVYEGDLFAPLPGTLKGRVNVLLANVPYVPTGEIALLPPEARDYEPRVTLDGGTDGLEVLRRVASEAAGWLAPGGRLLSEVSDRQVPDAVRAVELGGLGADVVRSEELSATVLVGVNG